MKIQSLLKKENWQKFFKHLIHFIKEIPEYLKFFVLLFIFLYQKFAQWLRLLPMIGNFLSRFFEKGGRVVGIPIEKLAEKINLCHPDVKTRRTFLIELAYKNLMLKKTRTFITIFGMAVGIGVIVFLISLGYGIERLIINQVATLEETKIIDVSAGENTSVRLDQNVYQRIKKIKDIKEVIPLVSVVGKLGYNKGSTDVIVYSVPRSYFEVGKQRLIKGKYYSDNATFDTKKISQKKEDGEVAGAYTQLKTKVKIFTAVDNSIINFNILPEERIGVWESCDIKSQFLGYAVRLEKGYQGRQYYGSSFYPFSDNGLVGIDEKSGQMVGLWIKSKFPLFQISMLGKDEVLVPIIDIDGQQKWSEGCIPQYKIKIEEKVNFGGQVLGEATSSASLNSATNSASLISSQEKAATEAASFLGDLTVVASSEGGIEVVSLSATSSAKTKKQVIEFKEPISGEAVVSLGLLNLLDIPVDKALKTDFDLSLVVVKSLLPEIEGKVTTAPVKYKVIGVLDDSTSAYLYIPFSDLYKLAVRNLSQLKVVLTEKNNLPKVRKEIETMGFKTSSVVDTIKQIEAFFGNIRVALAAIGLVALVLAALGMFNTLTVSLLERTREIGGMKVMGVVSHEIEDLFLAEAMIMGLGGGFGGLILGFLAGKLLSILVSAMAFASQRQFLDLTYIPLNFIIFIVLLSFFVGIATGLYPAQRAKKISALNALRYE
jgi:ABC-type antimicrobial peptide transport system permease subunit